MDWEAKVRELKRIIDELQVLSHELDGRSRMLLGRSADELKVFVNDLEAMLYQPEQEQHAPESIPDWLSTDVTSDEQSSANE